MANRHVVVDPAHPLRLVIQDVEDPAPQRNEAIVRVRAISLNRGEVRYSMTAPAGRRPGWDLAGVVEKAAADGSGPKEGARVVALMYVGAWGERVAVPTNAIAELPAGVTFEQAATLPVAGLTALHALYKGGNLAGKTVLVTGATGGTGDFTIQLAKLGGARVVGVSRNPARADAVRAFGADEVVTGDDPAAAAKFGPYHLVIDSVGGPTLGAALGMLTRGGTCVCFGTTAGTEVTFNASKFYSGGPVNLYGFILFQEFTQIETAGTGLRRLAELVAAGKLKPHIDLVEPWTNVAQVAKRLTDREFVGKAVLTVG